MSLGRGLRQLRCRKRWCLSCCSQNAASVCSTCSGECSLSELAVGRLDTPLAPEQSFSLCEWKRDAWWVMLALGLASSRLALSRPHPRPYTRNSVATAAQPSALRSWIEALSIRCGSAPDVPLARG
jgi:hypothetical protein